MRFDIIIVMKYFNQTLAYLFKYGRGRRFLILFLLAVLPSAAIAYAFPLSDFVSFIADFGSITYRDFPSMWKDAFNFDLYSLIALAAAFVLFVLFTAYSATVITRSIRVGEFGLTKIINSVNENFFPAVAVTVFYFVTIFVAHNLFILLAFLFVHVKSRVFGTVLAALFLILICVAVTYFFSALTLWLPTMSFSGQYVTKAFVNAFYKSRNYQRYFFLPSVVVTAVLAAFAFVAHFAASVWYVKWIINTLGFALSYTFALSFSAICYCDTESITREDMAKRYFGR